MIRLLHWYRGERTIRNNVYVLLLLWSAIGVVTLIGDNLEPSTLGSLETGVRDAGKSPRYMLPLVGETQAPPIAMQGDVRVRADFIWPEDVSGRCHSKDALACMQDIPGEPTIIMPNPCWFVWTDEYAAMLCHEIAHVNGWRHESSKECSPLPAMFDNTWQCEAVTAMERRK